MSGCQQVQAVSTGCIGGQAMSHLYQWDFNAWSDDRERSIPLKDLITYISQVKRALHVTQGHVGKQQLWSAGRKGQGEA